MLVPVDADYRFVCLDVGNNGSGSDAQIFNECHLKESIVDGMIGFLDADELPGDVSDTPYFIVAEDNFAPRTWLMKPFSGRNLKKEERIFNYRLSSAKRVVQNALGILANRF